ncbi:MAG: type II secretion system F family protein [Myxococcota bacterium]|nr:type II secretion system F family protein [Myxococcota bacterium]
MTGFLISVGLTVFCLLQAVYWWRRSRSSRRASQLLSRLGGASLHQEVALLKEADSSGPLLDGLRDALSRAGRPRELAPFFTKVLNFSLIFGFLGLLLGGSLISGLLGIAVGSYIPFFQLSQAEQKRLQQIERTLPEALQILIISLRSGHSIPQAVETTAAETSGPLQVELQVLSDEFRLGRSVEEGFLSFGQRLSGLHTVRTLAVSVIILQQTGGNLVEVLEQLINALEAQSQYARKLAAMTAEGRMSARILCGLPPLFLGMTWLAAPEYVEKLAEPGPGLVVSAIAATLYVAGYVWVQRLVNPKVGV